MSDGKWGDLGPRVGSAIAMLALGGVALWLGGVAFAALATGIVALMIWELVRMLRPGHDTAALQEAGLTGLAFALAVFFPGVAVLILLVLLMVIAGRTGAHIGLVVGFTAGIFLAGLGLVWLRGAGLMPTLWLVGLVIVTDVAGYFAGRIIGGPKFWPRVSPKKTWAGIIAGWIAAAALSAWFALSLYPVVWPLLAVLAAAVALSFASQMGDAAESALKRKMKVKDSSNLIPGHGGVMDRFDAMMGAALLLALVGALMTAVS